MKDGVCCLLELIAIKKTYGRGRSVLDGVNMTIRPGERVGLTGPSGCGKTTLAQISAFILQPDAGRIVLDGVPIEGWGWRVPAALRSQVQLLWQSPRSAVNPRWRLRDIIVEPLRTKIKTRPGKKELHHRLQYWCDRVGLTDDLLQRFPHEVSDGQLQRACLARALIVEPHYIICDEMVAMLDVSTAASLLHVIASEQQRRSFGVLLISHDKPLLEHWCHRLHTMISNPFA